MAQISYPNIITPGQMRIFWAQEPAYGQIAGTYSSVTNAGTGGTNTINGTTGSDGGTSTAFLEPCSTITSAIQRNPYEAREYVGVPVDLFDMIETTHHTTITISTPYRSNGIAAWALAALCGSTQGGAGDTVTASGAAYQHIIKPNNLSNVCNTFTVWHDQGDAQFTGQGIRGLLRMRAATVESVRLTFAPNTALMAEITIQAAFPEFVGAGTAGTGSAVSGVAVPTNYVRLGSDTTIKGSRMMGYQGVGSTAGGNNTSNKFGIVNSAGVRYKNQILTGEVTITRSVEVLESPYSQTPTYFLPGPIGITGSFDFLYDGLGALDGTASIMQDYLNLSALGAVGGATTNEVGYTDADGNGFDLQFYPVKWTSFTLNPSAQSLKASAGFTSYNSLAQAMSSPSRISSLYQVTLTNNIGAQMVA